MTLAIAYNPELDPFQSWQAAHGAVRCERMAATIALEICKRNQLNRRGDNRCRGCVGLFNQKDTKQVRRNFSLLRSLDQIIERADANAPKPRREPEAADGMADLDEIIDDLYTNPLPGDDFYDVELDLDEEQLLALFPELAASEDEDNEVNYPRFTEYQTEMPRYAVFKGRCPACGGYMENVKERHDDNVFRCLACSRRTGPEYEQNRNLQKIGMVFI